MKRRNSKATIEIAPESDDWSGIDVWIEDLPIAYRRRHISIAEYRQISIRKHYLCRAEYEKILDGEFKSPIYLFNFDDALIVCRTKDIKACLEMKLDNEVPNPDGITAGRYIDIDALPHLFIEKES